MAAGPQIVVVGAGAIGTWSALHLQRYGASVTLLDAWGPGNLRACSSGERRILRATYGPDAFYLPLVVDSRAMWLELEKKLGLTLFEETGLLWLFEGDDAYASSSVESLAEEGIVLESLAHEEVERRFPRIRLDGVRTAFFEPAAGVLAARTATRLLRDLFVQEGGRYRCARALPPAPAGGSLTDLEVADGPPLNADAYVFACGPWLREIFPDVLGHLIRPSRQEEYYLGPPPGPGYTRGELPVWLDFSDRMLYCVPSFEGRGVKVADDTRGEGFDPTDGDRVASQETLDRLRRFLTRRLPELAEAPLLEARVCQYENTPDGHLIVDRHPTLENAWIAGGGSGHAFKLAPAIGKSVAQAVLAGRATEIAFRLDRFGPPQSLAEPTSQYWA